MAVPQKPLIIVNFDPDRRTIKEHRAIWGSRYNIEQFADFLVQYVDHERSWTEDEIDAIAADELERVRTLLQLELIEMDKAKKKEAGADERPLVDSPP